MHTCRFLRDADLVIYMDGGRVHSCGLPADILPLVDARETSVASGPEAKDHDNNVPTSGDEEQITEVSCTINAPD